MYYNSFMMYSDLLVKTYKAKNEQEFEKHVGAFGNLLQKGISVDKTMSKVGYLKGRGEYTGQMGGHL